MKKPKKINEHIKEIKKKLEQMPEGSSRSLKQSQEKLVTVEIKKEFDVLEKSWENRVFVKLFVAARTSGLLKEIFDREFKTLIALILTPDRRPRQERFF